MGLKEFLAGSGKVSGMHSDPSLGSEVAQYFFTLDGKGLNFTAIKDSILEAANAIDRMDFSDVKGQVNGHAITHWISTGTSSMRNVASFITMWHALDGKGKSGIKDVSMAALDMEMDLDKAWKDVVKLWSIIAVKPAGPADAKVDSGLKVFLPIFTMITSRSVTTDEIGRVGRLLAKRAAEHYRFGFDAAVKAKDNNINHSTGGIKDVFGSSF